MDATTSSTTKALSWLPFLCLNLSLVFQVLSAGFGKQAALSNPHFSPDSIISNHFYFLSLSCLGFQAVVWPIALRRYSLSFAYFYMTASYVAVLFISAYVFEEAVTVFNIAGALLIALGVIIMVSGQPSAQRLQ